MAVLVNSRVKNPQVVSELLKKLPLAVSTDVMRSALHVAARPMVQGARSELKSLSHSTQDGRTRASSGSLALATRTWNSKRFLSRGVGVSGTSRFRRQGAIVHLGPKRDSSAAVRRYLSYYRSGSRVKSTSVARGVMHGHLMEYGTGLRSSKNGVEWNASTARHVYEHAGLRYGRSTTKRFEQVIGRSVDRFVRRFRGNQG